MKNSIRAEVLACTFMIMLSHSQAFAADWDLHALMNELGDRSSGHANFVEKKFLSVLDKPLQQSGTLAYAPGHLEKHTLSPRRERMTIDGDSLTIEFGSDKKKKHLRLSRYPVLWGFVEGMRATLTGDLVTLQRFYEIELHGSRGDWELALIPRQKQMRSVVRLVSIRGGAGRIKLIELLEATGDRTVTQVTEDAS